MAEAFEVVDCGLDSSGRTVRMTRRSKLMFDIACEAAGVEPVIVQGMFMGQNSAAASAGTHNLAGCIDTRTWDLTDEEIQRLVRAARSVAAVVWCRKPPAFEEHMHWLFLGDKPMDADAAAQVSEYLAGGDGLQGSARDPQWRPSPLVTDFDYRAATATAAQEDDMQLDDKLFPDREDSPTIRETLVAANHANRKLDKVLERLADFRMVTAERDQALAADLDRISESISDAATKQQIKQAVRRLRAVPEAQEQPSG